jgi:P4 family phage/plasmid primase-like protien
MAEACTKHPISGFIRQRAVAPGNEFSLTGMGPMKGSFFIPDADYPTFLDLLHDYLFKHRLVPISLVEQRSPEKPYPVLIDLDFKYSPEKALIRVFSDDHIRNFVKKYSEGVRKFIGEFPTGSNIRFFVSLRPQPYKNKKTGKDDELKDGVHIESPDLVMTSEKQRALRTWTLQNSIIQNTFEKKATKYINADEDVFDEALVKKNGWFMYGESKHTIPSYTLHKVYVLDTETGEIDEEPTSNYTNRQLMEILSIRYNLREPIEDRHLSDETREEFRQLMGPVQQPPRVKSPVLGPSTNEIVDLEPLVANYLIPPQSERDFALIRRLVLECLSTKRADNYGTWRETEWCLRNINDSEDMFKLWIEFSKKSDKSGDLNIEREYRDWVRGGASHGKKLTKRSLHYWAREDNPDKYNEILKADLVEWISQGRCKNTHNHIAQLMNLLYDGDYRVAMNSKITEWYRYRKNMWQKMVQGVELRIKLSNEIADIIAEGRKERRQWLAQQGDGTQEVGNDQIFKDLLAIEKNLYSCGFKDSVMKEAASIFYEEDFEKKLNSITTTLGCANGILDLRAKRLRADGSEEEYVRLNPGKPEDYVSFMAGNNPPEFEPLEYIPYSVDDPNQAEIMDFFKKIFPRDDLREYVLILLSSCLEGANREQCYYIMTGVGGNGKSKLVELMRYTLGDYLTSLSTTAITRKRPDSGSANPDIIKIKNKRVIIMQEPDPNEPINTSRMKQFSGEDDVEARGLFQDQDTFKITGKLFMSCNKLPPINTMDVGTWRRIRVLPFETKFVDPGDASIDPAKNIHPKDYSLDVKLKKWRQSFLSLLVHYYETKYLTIGLVPPPIVTQHSNEYKNAYDSFGKFFDLCVRKEPEADDVTFTKIFKTYKAWYSGTKETCLKEAEFKTRLEEKLNITITKYVRGIHLFSTEEEAEQWDKESEAGSK